MRRILPVSFILAVLLFGILANLFLVYRELGDFYNLVVKEETERVKSLVESALASGGDPVEAVASYMQSSKLLKGVTFSLEGRNIIIPGSDISDEYYKVNIVAKPFKFTLYYDFHYVKELNKHIFSAFLFLIIFTVVFVLILFVLLKEYYKEKILLQNTHKEKEKLESINLVIHSILHEVKNRLNVFRLLLYKIEKECKSSVIELLKKEITSLSKYVEETADLRKPLKLKKEKIQLQPVVESVIYQFKELFDSRKIEVVINLENCLLEADKEKLKSVIADLFKNAVEAVGEEGVIEVLSFRKGKNCILEIRDSALKPFDAQKVFFPFYSTKKSGFGLGLYNVKRIVEAHGGRVEALQTKNRTIFRIILPII